MLHPMTDPVANGDYESAMRSWIAVAVLSIAASAVAHLVARHTLVRPDLLIAAGFAFAFLVARVLTIRLPQGDEVSITLIVGLVGLAVANVPMLIAASIVAAMVDIFARLSQPTLVPTSSRIRSAIRASALLGLAAPWQLILHPLAGSGLLGDSIVLWALAAGTTLAVMDLLTQGLDVSLSNHRPLADAAMSLARPLGMVYVVHISIGAVVLRLQALSGFWPFPAAILLTMILQNSFNLYMRIRRAYVETIGALANAAELDRPADAGHARRVSDLAVAVGRRMGLSSRELERVGYAALLHDIGRMGAGGDGSFEVHSARGAEIAAAIPFLADVAPLILWSPDGDAATPPLGWAIVRACSRYDRLRAGEGGRAAIDEIASQPDGLDSKVIDVLRELTERPSGGER